MIHSVVSSRSALSAKVSLPLIVTTAQRGRADVEDHFLAAGDLHLVACGWHLLVRPGGTIRPVRRPDGLRPAFLGCQDSDCADHEKSRNERHRKERAILLASHDINSLSEEGLENLAAEYSARGSTDCDVRQKHRPVHPINEPPTLKAGTPDLRRNRLPYQPAGNRRCCDRSGEQNEEAGRAAGLAAYYSRFGQAAACLALHPRYEDCGIAAKRTRAFAEAVGARVELKIEKATCRENPQCGLPEIGRRRPQHITKRPRLAHP